MGRSKKKGDTNRKKRNRPERGVEIFPDWSEEDERILDQIWTELGYPPDDDDDLDWDEEEADKPPKGKQDKKRDKK